MALAVEHNIAALVLDAPFTSVAEVAQRHFPYVPASRMVVDRFDSLARIGRVKAPILVLHGERDRVVPVRYGRALLGAAPEPKGGWFAPEAGHADLARYGSLDVVVTFIDRHLGGSSLLLLPDIIGDTPGTRILSSNGALCVDSAVNPQRSFVAQQKDAVWADRSLPGGWAG